MPFSQDDFKKTFQRPDINSPPQQEQPKENPLPSTMGDAQKLKIPKDATRKFKQIYLQMMANTTSSEPVEVAQENSQHDKQDETYLSLDFKPKTKILSKTEMMPPKETEKAEERRIEPKRTTLKDVSKIAETQSLTEPSDKPKVETTALPTAKGILDKWKMYRQQLEKGKSSEETETLHEDEFLGLSKKGKKDISLSESEGFLAEKKTPSMHQGKWTDGKIDTFPSPDKEWDIPEKTIHSVEKESGKLPLPVGRVPETKHLMTEKRTLDSMSSENKYTLPPLGIRREKRTQQIPVQSPFQEKGLEEKSASDIIQEKKTQPMPVQSAFQERGLEEKSPVAGGVDKSTKAVSAPPANNYIIEKRSRFQRTTETLATKTEKIPSIPETPAMSPRPVSMHRETISNTMPEEDVSFKRKNISIQEFLANMPDIDSDQFSDLDSEENQLSFPKEQQRQGQQTANIPANEFSPESYGQGQQTANIPVNEFLPESYGQGQSTANIPVNEFLPEAQVKTSTQKLATESQIATQRWKKGSDQEQTGSITSIYLKEQQQTEKPADIDLTVAAKAGEFDPSLKKDTGQNFSWESLLRNKTIARDKLISSSSDSGGLDAIKILQLLGRGANGEIYEVECKRFYPYKYALKIPLMPLNQNGPIFEREVAQFHRIQAAESLHIPKILSGEFHYENMKIPYYVTYLLSPIERMMKDAKKKLLSPPYVFVIFYSLLKALEDLSYGFIIHNDIKPDNIMFCKDVPMFVDFGVSKSYSEINELELWKKRGYLHGTPIYLPPEVIQIVNRTDGEHILFRLENVSQRMDIWALGLTFMEWLSGYRIFHDLSLGENVLETLSKIQHYFQEGYIAKYKEQCLRKLTRMYLGTDVLTQQRMKDSDILEFYDKKYVHKQKVDVEDIEVKKTFLGDLFKIFDLCTLPYDKRPKAGQLLEEIKGIFPQAKDKYDSLYYESITPPLEKTFLKKLNMESFKKTYYLLKGRRQYEAKRDGGWQCMNKRYDQWISFTTIFNDFFSSLNIKDMEYPVKQDLEESKPEDILDCELFPFDRRYIFYHNLVKRDKSGLLSKIGQNTPTFVVNCKHSQDKFSPIFATKNIADSSILSPDAGEEAFIFPLYVVEGQEFICNLSPLFISIIEQELEWEFTTQEGDFERTFNHENAFHYIYGILHSPIYRTRYSKYFQNEFCRIPILNQKKLFRQISIYGKEIIALHFFEAECLSNPLVSCPVTGKNKIEEKSLRYVPPTETKQGRVYINESQYFEGINQQVWEFSIGNYQICHEFLRSRTGISLDYEELVHYQKMVFAIQETLRLMEEIDKTLLSAWSTV